VGSESREEHDNSTQRVTGGLARFWDPLWDAEPAERAALEAERRAFNTRRVVLLAPIMLASHAISFVYFGWGVAPPPAAPTAYSNVQTVHAVTFVLFVTLLLARRSARAAAHLGELAVALYIGYGVALSANAQLASRGVEVFLIVVLATAVVLRLRSGFATAVYALGLGTLLLAVSHLQQEAVARVSALANAVPVTIVGWVLSRNQVNGFFREARQKRTIVAQRDQLITINDSLDKANDSLARQKAGLEEQVRAQLREIMARVEEVEELDRRLRERVKDRARELELALATIGSSRATEPRVGDTIGDRYRIESLLGRGGMGVVYRASDTVSGRTVAVKMLQRVSNQAGIQRFLREVEAMASVKHPAVAQSLHVDISESGQPFQVQELVVGPSLERERERRLRLTPEHVARLGAVLADALATAHAIGVVHRDIKPSNVILLDSAPGLKLLDFGISKLRERSATVTETGCALGTPAFMAPEQVTAAAEVGGAADVYSLGVTLYLLLSGRLPFPEMSVAKLLMAHVAMAPAPLGDHTRGVPDALVRAIMTCLQKAPELRPAAGELAALLTGIANDLGAAPLDVIHARQKASSAADTPSFSQ
jgi:serine/threonine-protein kinase